MNNFLFFLIIIVIVKVFVQPSFYIREGNTITSDPYVHGSNLKKSELDTYLEDIRENPSEIKYYNDAIKLMNSEELKSFHNSIFNQIITNNQYIDEQKNLGLEEALNTFKSENVKDVSGIRLNIDGQLDDINNNFSRQVLANFKQNYNHNMNNRLTYLYGLQNEALQSFTDELYGYET